MDNTAVFYTVNVGSIPARRTKRYSCCKNTTTNSLTLNGVGAIIIA